MSESSWECLLARVRDDLPTLLSDFLGELQSLQGYADGTVPQDDIERTALQAFGLFLDRLADPTGSAGSSDFPNALGRRRARQGIGIDHFTEGVRINFRLLWRALHRAAQPDLVGELVENGEHVLNVVERYATEVQGAFLDETQIMAQLQWTARERALSSLFSGSSTAEELRFAAETLSLTDNCVFELIAIDRARAPEFARAAHATDGVLSHEDDEMIYLFRRRKGVIDWPLSSLEAPGVYLSQVRGLSALAPAANLARRIRHLGGSGRIHSLRDAFAPLVHSEIRAHVAGFEEELVGMWQHVRRRHGGSATQRIPLPRRQSSCGPRALFQSEQEVAAVRSSSLGAVTCTSTVPLSPPAAAASAMAISPAPSMSSTAGRTSSCNTV